MSDTTPRIPKLRRLVSGELDFADTPAAQRWRACRKTLVMALPQEEVHADAQRRAREAGYGEPDPVTLRGFYELQLGMFQGKTFHWLAENALGYAAYLVCSTTKEGGGSAATPLGLNKQHLKVRPKMVIVCFW